jgi:hypothetical protein
MRRLVASALVVSLACSQGCALLVRGTTETVGVSGTGLEVDGKPEKSGPLELRRRQIHVVSALVNGQRETRTVESDLSVAWFILDFAVFGVLLAPVGSIAFVVDLATGSLYDLDPVETIFPATDAAVTSAVCPACGAIFGEHAKFCAECGARR